MSVCIRSGGVLGGCFGAAAAETTRAAPWITDPLPKARAAVDELAARVNGDHT